jgi:hypothetical protein
MRIRRRFLARVKNFAMGQRSRESDIRIAVRATRGNVMAVVFHHGETGPADVSNPHSQR